MPTGEQIWDHLKLSRMRGQRDEMECVCEICGLIKPDKVWVGVEGIKSGSLRVNPTRTTSHSWRWETKSCVQNCDYVTQNLMKEQKNWENSDGLKDFLHNFMFSHLASSSTPSFFVTFLPLSLRFNYLSWERERQRQRERGVNAEYRCSTLPQHPLLASKKTMPLGAHVHPWKQGSSSKFLFFSVHATFHACIPFFLLPGMSVKGFDGSLARKSGVFPQSSSVCGGGAGLHRCRSARAHSHLVHRQTDRNCPPPTPFIQTLRLVLPTAI